MGLELETALRLANGKLDRTHDDENRVLAENHAKPRYTLKMRLAVDRTWDGYKEDHSLNKTSRYI